MLVPDHPFVPTGTPPVHWAAAHPPTPVRRERHDPSGPPGHRWYPAKSKAPPLSHSGTNPPPAAAAPSAENKRKDAGAAPLRSAADPDPQIASPPLRPDRSGCSASPVAAESQ